MWQAQTVAEIVNGIPGIKMARFRLDLKRYRWQAALFSLCLVFQAAILMGSSTRASHHAAASEIPLYELMLDFSEELLSVMAPKEQGHQATSMWMAMIGDVRLQQIQAQLEATGASDAPRGMYEALEETCTQLRRSKIAHLEFRQCAQKLKLIERTLWRRLRYTSSR